MKGRGFNSHSVQLSPHRDFFLLSEWSVVSAFFWCCASGRGRVAAERGYLDAAGVGEAWREQLHCFLACFLVTFSNAHVQRNSLQQVVILGPSFMKVHSMRPHEADKMGLREADGS